MDWNWLFDIVFPTSCVSCKTPLEEGMMACKRCLEKIELCRTLFCPSCRARLPTPESSCHEPRWYRLGAAASYDDPTVASLIHALKFDFVRCAARPLGQLLVSYVQTLRLPLGHSVIIPVPLSKRRIRERGFNQSQLLSEMLAKELGLPHAPQALHRVKNTPPQSNVAHFKERFENVRSCFEIGPASKIIRGCDVLLVDDVTTSGATFRETAGILKKAGARSVTALAVARAGR
jgi:ComF family protein